MIHAVMDGVRNDGICGSPTRDFVFDIGTFSPGSYTLQVDYSYCYYACPPNDIIVETIAVILFDVSPATGTVAVPVPILDLAELAGLAVLLTALSVATLRRRLR